MSLPKTARAAVVAEYGKPTGYGVAQTNDDSARGHLLRETEASRVGMGPIVEYNNKWVGINLYYIRDIEWNRAFGGDNFFFKVTVRF